MSSNNWKVLYSTKFGTNSGGNYKMARVSKFTNDEDIIFIYVDIRNYNNKNNATKNGICLKPEEFIWFIKRCQQKKYSSRLEKNNRQLIIKKFGSDGIIMNMVTYSKTITYTLEGFELRSLIKRSKEILQKLNYIGSKLTDKKPPEKVLKTPENEISTDEIGEEEEAAITDIELDEGSQEFDIDIYN